MEGKIPDNSGLVKKINYNTKITELENKLPDISNLATKAVLTTIENKIPDVSSLASSLVDNKTKITDIENKLTNHNHSLNPLYSVNPLYLRITDMKGQFK